MADPSAASSLLKRTVIDFLRQHPPFSQLDDDHLDLLAERASVNYFPDGTRILGPADGMPGRYYIVHRGEVRSAPPGQFASDAGGVAALHPGESFPLGALVEGRAVVNDYVAGGDTFCYEFDKAAFDMLLARSTAFATFCTRRIAHLLQESRRQARAQAQEASHARHNMTSLVSTLLRKPAVTCKETTSLRDALLVMRDQRIGSMVAVDGANRAVGILTERDVLDRIVLEGRPLDIPFASVMTPAPRSIEESATAFDAALLMARHAIRHLPVTRGGELVGVISERDLFAAQRASMREVGRSINQAADGGALEQAAADVRKLARNLQAQGMALDQLTLLIVALNDRLVERAIDMVRRDTGFEAQGACWIALGSEGRMEQTVSTDQDNGLVFEPTPGESVETCRERLLAFAGQVNQLLARLGFPLCKGGIMAGNPKWCLTIDEWKQRFGDWLRNPTPEALLNAAIFFDFRALQGEIRLATELRAWLVAEVKERPAFLRMMAANALGNTPPLNIFGELATSGSLDLKGQGARPFIDAARVLALADGTLATQTTQRLRLGAARHGTAREAEALVEAFEFIQNLRLTRQFRALDDGGPPNQIEISTLNELDRRILKEAFRQARKLQSRLRLDYAL